MPEPILMMKALGDGTAKGTCSECGQLLGIARLGPALEDLRRVFALHEKVGTLRREAQPGS